MIMHGQNRHPIASLCLLILLAGTVVALAACGGGQTTPANADTSSPRIAGEGITFLYFFRDNCPPCATMDPVVASLESDYGDRLSVQRYNADSDEGRQLMEQYDLRDAPSYAMVGPDGAKLWGLTGPIHRDMLRQQVQLRVGR
ncbi:MAG: hypothetical protein DCC55_00240 [Chloroflexi bacterium]|nr:MAG: hypothetical protein DCC55_00240 [Chloroflexota bacterium]